MSRKRTKPIIETIPGYTVKQSQFLRGELGVDDINGRFATWLLKNATTINDKKTIEIASNLIQYFKDEAHKKNLERARERARCIYNNEEIVWKQPKSTEYTERQKKIARGELPLKEVHSNELVSLCKKAKASGDDSLYDMIYDIILDRREEERNKTLKRLGMLSPSNDDFDDYDGREFLTDWEEAILRNRIDRSECSTKHLEHILDVIRKTGNEKDIEVAEHMVAYRHDPTIIYVTQDTEEALQIIELATGLPIRRKNTWFVD